MREAIDSGIECEICGEVATDADHCHKENQGRGPLCGMCNSGLAFFRDDPDLLRAAADYVEEYIAIFRMEKLPDPRDDKELRRGNKSPFGP